MYLTTPKTRSLQTYRDSLETLRKLKQNQHNSTKNTLLEKNVSLFDQLSYFGNKDAFTRQIKFLEDKLSCDLDEIEHCIDRLYADLAAHHARVVELEEKVKSKENLNFFLCVI